MNHVLESYKSYGYSELRTIIYYDDETDKVYKITRYVHEMGGDKP